jgi:hypothetical protein
MRRIPANAEGKVFVLLGEPFNVGAYVDRETIVALSAGPSRRERTHFYDLTLTRNGMGLTGHPEKPIQS